MCAARRKYDLKILYTVKDDINDWLSIKIVFAIVVKEPFFVHHPYEIQLEAYSRWIIE